MNGRAPGVLNRVVLTLVGLGAAVAGGWSLLLGTGALGAERARHRPIAPEALDRLLDRPWFGYAVAVGATLIALLALVWLLAQLPRRTGAGTIVLAEEGGIARIDHEVVAAAARAEIESYEGVHSARVVLLGEVAEPTVGITVTADRCADLSALRERIHGVAVDHLGQALETESPITTRLLFVTPRSKRSAMTRVRTTERTPAGHRRPAGT